MQLTAPVTDYIRASTLTQHGDLLVRGAAVPERYGRPGLHAMLYHDGSIDRPAWYTIENTLGLIFKAQGAGNAALFQPLHLSDTGVHVADDTRNAVGEQVIAGVGFEPSIVIFIAVDDTGANLNYSWGFGNVANNSCVYQSNGGINSGLSGVQAIMIQRDGGNWLQGRITAVGADGFTITWVIGGACVVDFLYLCLP